GRARHFSGVLIGIAAAVKLTPLIFVGHLLLTGRRADAARAFGTFLALQGFMLAIAWHDTVRYWTHTITDPSRIGPTDGMWNQSLGGMVRRLSELAPWSQQVAFLIGALLAIPAALLVRRFHKRERPVHALLVSAFTGLLLSPVSWLHHWVWVAPLLVLLVAEAGCGNRLAKWLMPATIFVFVIPVPRILIHFTTRLWDGVLI